MGLYKLGRYFSISATIPSAPAARFLARPCPASDDLYFPNRVQVSLQGFNLSFTRFSLFSLHCSSSRAVPVVSSKSGLEEVSEKITFFLCFDSSFPVHILQRRCTGVSRSTRFSPFCSGQVQEIRPCICDFDSLEKAPPSIPAHSRHNLCCSFFVFRY